MNKCSKLNLYLAIGFLFSFLVLTILVCFVDVKVVGPNEANVGLASINLYFHKITGENMMLYLITDWLGLVPVFIVIGFAIFGLAQWINRKRLLKVDCDILVLGGFYLIVFLLYFLFETFVINYRPVLINGFLEVSYPSSTTLLVLCVIPTAIMQFTLRIKNIALKKFISIVLSLFAAFMVIARFVSGVHWFTDIIGGIFLSLSLVLFYRYVITSLSNK